MRGLRITERITGLESESFKAYLREVSKIEKFESAEAEAEVAMKAFEYRNIAETCEDKAEAKMYMDEAEVAISELVSRNLRFVISVAKQYLNNNVDLEDLVNEGNAGLLDAARRFDPTTGNKFISYAVWYVRKDIMNYLTKNSRTIKLPSNKVNTLVNFNNKVNDVRQRLGRDVTISDLLGEVDGYTDKEIHDLMEVQTITTTSMDIKFDDDGNSSTLSDVLTSDSIKSTDHLVLEESKNELLEKVLSRLSDRDKKIMKLYYGIGINSPMNLHEIGTEVGLSREAVRLIKEKSLKKMRVSVKKLGIESFML
jgi:RNA polymerase primary sigma factor